MYIERRTDRAAYFINVYAWCADVDKIVLSPTVPNVTNNLR